jgi:hypothetical protein
VAGLWVVLGVLVIGSVAGVVLRARNGRIRTAPDRSPRYSTASAR